MLRALRALCQLLARYCSLVKQELSGEQICAVIWAIPCYDKRLCSLLDKPTVNFVELCSVPCVWPPSVNSLLWQETSDKQMCTVRWAALYYDKRLCSEPWQLTVTFLTWYGSRAIYQSSVFRVHKRLYCVPWHIINHRPTFLQRVDPKKYHMPHPAASPSKIHVLLNFYTNI